MVCFIFIRNKSLIGYKDYKGYIRFISSSFLQSGGATIIIIVFIAVTLKQAKVPGMIRVELVPQ